MSSDNGYINVRPNLSRITNTRWVWNNRIPEGGLVEMIGEEDVGKGFYACHLVSRLTRGMLPGKYDGEPVNVQVVAYEDDKGEWDKRLAAADAEPDMWSYLEKSDGTVPDLRYEAEEIVAHWHKSKIRFVYIDQLLDHMGVTDTYHQKEVRDVLGGFHALCVKSRVTVLATMHPNKKGDSPRARLAGSAALWQPCRSAFYLGVHPDDEAVRVLLNTKNNRAARKARTIEFQIVDTDRDFRIGGKHIRTGVVHVLTEESSLSIDDVLGQGRPKNDRSAELDRRMTDALSENGGVPYPELKADEYFGNFTFNSLKRSLARIGGTVTTHSPGSPSVWYLPRVRERAGGKIVKVSKL
jgi:AAA domain